jgi:hypothetical protein
LVKEEGAAAEHGGADGVEGRGGEVRGEGEVDDVEVTGEGPRDGVMVHVSGDAAPAEEAEAFEGFGGAGGGGVGGSVFEERVDGVAGDPVSGDDMHRPTAVAPIFGGEGEHLGVEVVAEWVKEEEAMGGHGVRARSGVQW